MSRLIAVSTVDTISLYLSYEVTLRAIGRTLLSDRAPLRCPLYSELGTANCSLLFFLNQEVLNLLSKLSKPLTPLPRPMRH